MFWKTKGDHQSEFFVSIGAGINQIPLIEEAKRLGLNVIGVDKSISSSGIYRCDIRIQESIDNYEEIYKKLRELLFDGEIKGVLSRSYGRAIKTSCYIANKLDIPHIPFERIDDFIDKKRMKGVFKKNKLKSPEFSILHNNRDNCAKKRKICFPFVIKPIVGHAKINVRLIRNNSDLERYLSRCSNNGGYIIEEYIEGEEIISVGIVHKGKFHLVDITDKIVTSLPYFVDLMHISPSKYYHLWDRIIKIGQDIADCFGIITSPLIMELIVSKGEDIYIIEAAPEFGGEFLSDILIPKRTGYNVLKNSINAIRDRDFIKPVRVKGRNVVVVKYITGCNGKLVSFSPIQPGRDGILFSKIFKDIGSKVKEPQANLDRIGVIITSGKTRDEAIERTVRAQKGLNIRIMS